VELVVAVGLELEVELVELELGTVLVIELGELEVGLVEEVGSWTSSHSFAGMRRDLTSNRVEQW
jgi:hypothetical protein